MARPRRPAPLDEHEARVRTDPDFYVAAAFRGAGVYERERAATLDEAIEKARGLVQDRPVSIYAVKGVHQSHVANVTAAGVKFDER